MKHTKISHNITIRDGLTVEKYFNEVSKQKLLKKEEERDLGKRIQEGDKEALNKLVKANLRFVISIAKQYQHFNFPLNDLINEGNLGLIKAAQLFDPDKGFKFISYAVFWIRQCIMEALSKHGRTIRMPENKLNEMQRINEAVALMQQKLEREPTAEELAEFMGEKPEMINNVTGSAYRQSSLDAPFNNEEEGTLLEIIRNPEEVPVDQNLDKDSMKSEIQSLLSLLNEREKTVITKAFGLFNDFSVSLEDIAEEMEISRERVRQIKENALKKLKSRAAILKKHSLS